MPKPVFIGDTLRVETEVMELRESKSRPNAGIVTFRHRAFNQRDEMVCEALRIGTGQAGMRLRSLLFVPGDRPDRMVKALGIGRGCADPGSGRFRRCREEERSPQSSRRIPGAAARAAALRADQSAGHRSRTKTLPRSFRESRDGIVLPKAEGGAVAGELDRRLDRLGDRETRILPIATETPAAIFALGSYGGVTRRASLRPDLGRGGLARRDRRGQRARGRRTLYRALRNGAGAGAVCRACRRGAGDRDHLSRC